MKKICFLFLILLLVGCSSKNVKDYAGYENNFRTNSGFYYQYEVVIKENGKVYSYPLDFEKYLPSNTIDLSCTILLRNLEVPFKIWYDITYYNLDNEAFSKQKILVHKDKKLPGEMLVKIGMPYRYKKEVKVCFYCYVEDSNGRVFYKTAKAVYKIGSKNIKKKGDVL